MAIYAGVGNSVLRLDSESVMYPELTTGAKTLFFPLSRTKTITEGAMMATAGHFLWMRRVCIWFFSEVMRWISLMHGLQREISKMVNGL